MKRIVLVGGGSGGHFYPLMSIAESILLKDSTAILYYMGPDHYDAKALQQHSITFISCPSGKQRRYHSILNFFDIFKVLAGVLIAIVKLYCIYPDVVISKGGYASVPIILAAAFLRIPIIVHESDTRPGKANALGARFAKSVCISFESARPFFKNSSVVFTGIPMRSELLLPKREGTEESLGLEAGKPTILVLGGSQGAERINQLVLNSLNELLPSYNIVHQTGKAGFELTVLSARELISDDVLLAGYRPIAFFDDPALLNDVYHAASVIISRAGSTSLYEIAAHGKPSIVIPIPETISHDQRTNAYEYAHTGAATVIEEHNLTEHLLTSEIDRIIKNSEIQREMSQKAFAFAPSNGGAAIADMAIRIAAEHS
jgi:UDP-N-acetylglucosamine--N-acetylmuramyl-(pentapeptide) pyrophosphoryl-undecaprenol N-acetylglucosamine transferase